MVFALCCGIFCALLTSLIRSSTVVHSLISLLAKRKISAHHFAKSSSTMPGIFLRLKSIRTDLSLFFAFFCGGVVKGSSGDGTINLTMGFALCCGIFCALPTSLIRSSTVVHSLISLLAKRKTTRIFLPAKGTLHLYHGMFKIAVFA